MVAIVDHSPYIVLTPSLPRASSTVFESSRRASDAGGDLSLIAAPSVSQRFVDIRGWSACSSDLAARGIILTIKVIRTPSRSDETFGVY